MEDKRFNNEEYTKRIYIDERKDNYCSHNFILEFIKKEPILDIGCGHGNLLEKCSKRFDDCSGIELSKVAVGLCTCKGLNVSEKSIEEFETEKKFKTIIAIDVLEHVDNINLVCKKVRNLLSYDGVFLVIIPNPNSIKSKISLVKNPKLDPAHIYCPTLKKAKEIFISCGFNILKVSGIGKLKHFPRLSDGMFFMLSKKRIKELNSQSNENKNKEEKK